MDILSSHERLNDFKDTVHQRYRFSKIILAQNFPDFHENPPKHIFARPVAAVSPIGVITCVFDDFSVFGR